MYLSVTTHSSCSRVSDTFSAFPTLVFSCFCHFLSMAPS